MQKTAHKRKKTSAKKPSTHRKKNKKNKRFWKKRHLLLVFLLIGLFSIGFYYRTILGYYYSSYFRIKKEHSVLKNTPYETMRMERIISEHHDKVFGIDISHYQRKEDIEWDSMTIAGGAISIDFVVLRATMGNASTDKHFADFWMKAQKHGKIRGAYHFYRADEDPAQQAKNFIATVHLEADDLPPVLDIEKIPRRRSKEQLIADLKKWCNIIENHYGKKPIIYTYYYYYKDFLRGEFEGYPLWLANYNNVLQPSPTDHWDLWQFSEKGIVYGINTKVDLNVFNGSLQELKKFSNK